MQITREVPVHLGDAPIQTAPRVRSLFPREHGAYGQLAFPLVTALAASSPGAASVGFTILAAAAFVAHEPLLVVLGLRGGRALREDGARARRLLGWLEAIGLSAAAVAAASAPAGALLALAAPLALGAVFAAFVLRRREKTVAGEIVAAAALTSFALPVGLAGGQALRDVLPAFVAWTATFVMATVTVHALVRFARAGVRVHGAALAVASVGVAGALFAGALVPHAGWALAPGAAATLALLLVRPSPRHLRKVGWTLVATSAATLFCLTVVLA